VILAEEFLSDPDSYRELRSQREIAEEFLADPDSYRELRSQRTFSQSRGDRGEISQRSFAD
jgi:hypothetical protein